MVIASNILSRKCAAQQDFKRPHCVCQGFTCTQSILLKISQIIFNIRCLQESHCLTHPTSRTGISHRTVQWTCRPNYKLWRAARKFLSWHRVFNSGCNSSQSSDGLLWRYHQALCKESWYDNTCIRTTTTWLLSDVEALFSSGPKCSLLYCSRHNTIKRKTSCSYVQEIKNLVWQPGPCIRNNVESQYTVVF